MRPRDSQRSRVYAWDKAVNGGSTEGSLEIEEIEALVKRIWRAERGRYGHAAAAIPAVHDGRGRRRPGSSRTRHAILLPRWCRSEWMVAHELAHLLDTRANAAHGPRFVGILMGIASRHLGRDLNELQARADELGVKYFTRAVGGPRVHESLQTSDCAAGGALAIMAVAP